MTLVKKKPVTNILLTSIILFSSYTGADVITGEIKFIKKPPFSGVLFVNQVKDSKTAATMDQLNKQFTKKVAIGSPGSIIKFENSDSFDHNIFANDLESNISFDVGLMPSGQTTELKMDWKQDTMVRLACKIHPKMRTYIANVNSDYYQTFEFQKKVKSYPVKIENIPSDNNSITLMIPKYEKIKLNINIGESKTVDLIKKGKIRGSLTVSRH